jgi:serine/threonine protein kinase
VRAGAVLSDRFEIGALAGEGAMGAVHSAIDRLSGERVAVKLLHDVSSQHVARFAREAALLASLDHRYIVRYIAHGTDGDRPYLVTEWLEGEELSARLARGRLGVRETLLLARHLSEALGEAHRHGIVHRDVKPTNVFLVDGSLEEPRLLDFGVARPVGVPELTASGAMVGTIGYLAPEQARGLPDIDARADVFALGATLFKCLTGTRPFACTDTLAWLTHLATGEVPSVRAERPEVPEALDALIASMLQPPRELRPADGDQVSAALHEVAAACERALASSTSAPPRPRAATSQPAPSWDAAAMRSTVDARRDAPDTTHGPVVSQRPRLSGPGPRRRALIGGAAVSLAVAAGAIALWGRVLSPAPVEQAQSPSAAPPGPTSPAPVETSAAPGAAEASAAAPGAAEASAADAGAPAADAAPERPALAASTPSASAAPRQPAPPPTPPPVAGAFDEARAKNDLRAAITSARAKCWKPSVQGEHYLVWVNYEPKTGVGAVNMSPAISNKTRQAMSCAYHAIKSHTFQVQPYDGREGTFKSATQPIEF